MIGRVMCGLILVDDSGGMGLCLTSRKFQNFREVGSIRDFLVGSSNFTLIYRIPVLHHMPPLKAGPYLNMQMVIVPHRLTAVKPDFIVAVQVQPGF